ncbi:O-methyltransferase 2 [Cinnamomum micranthum f. kanehirae]|uniref:O-methyltransferase 2 n=1 Tax=Cinnamomum micranthum f. kanehirae TaxID=337451 RepID=A0A443NHR9_9MAGN|nr:O-methyltransferase 2 [Cinnamomum micranthum f. kanehirae]
MAEEDPQEQLLQAQILKHTFGFVYSFVLKCSIELGIFDTIHNNRGNPMTLSILATSISNTILSISNHKLYRLLNYLVHMGLLQKHVTFAVEGEGRKEEPEFSLTDLGEFLLKDGEKSLASWALAIIDEGDMGCWHQLSSCCSSKDDQRTAFERIYGASVWDLAAKDAEVNRVINDAMAGDTRLVMPAFIQGCSSVLEGIGSMVDVGGGTGMAMSMVAEAFPHLKCMVFDLPHVVATAPQLSHVSMVGGDMFQSVPSADAILLKFMLHNWQDDECVKILKKCKEAIPKEAGKVIIMDIVVDSEMENSDLTHSKLSLDIDMMITSGGRERTVEEWERLLDIAGFRSHEIIPIITIQSVIVAYP